MISSASAKIWSEFRARPETNDETLAPASELSVALKKSAHRLKKERDSAAESTDQWRRNVAEVVVAVEQLSRMLEHHRPQLEEADLGRVHKDLRVLKDKIVGAYEAAGMQAIDPTGSSFRQVTDLIEVVGWVHGEQFTREVVAETIQPIILHEGHLAKPGLVKCGAPLREGNAHESVSESE